MFRLLAVLLCTVVAVSCETETSYSGHQVYQIFANSAQEKLLQPFYHVEGYDFWGKFQNSSRQEIHLMVAPGKQESILQILAENKIDHSVLIPDVEKVFEEERSRQASDISPRSISFNQYHRYDTIRNYLQQLASTHRSTVSVEDIGFTTEGRPINIIKISSGGSGTRPVIAIEAGIHAREWIAPALALYIINQLVENSANADLIRSVDWHIVPVLNPDGYEFTHTSTRLWRKTRSRNSGSSCIGTDPNRNFDYYWLSSGASTNPCAETYAGTHAFSEPETAAYRNYVLENRNRIKLYVAVHSYGNYFLYPWGYTSALPSDWRTLDNLARSANAAQVAAGGRSYAIGSSTNVLYAAAGGSDDWVKAVGGVALSYTIELPGGGINGFDLPASQIQNVVSTFFPAIRVLGHYVRDNF